MPSKKELVQKLTAKPIPRNFTVRDLDALMSKCNCEKYQGGRGSGIGYRYIPTGRCNLRSPTATGAVVNGHSAVHQRSA